MPHDLTAPEPIAHLRIDQLCERFAELELKVERLTARVQDLERDRLSCSTEPPPPSSSRSGHGAQGDPATPLQLSGDETAEQDDLSIGCTAAIDTDHGVRLGTVVGFLESGKVAVQMYGQHYAIERSKLRRHEGP